MESHTDRQAGMQMHAIIVKHHRQQQQQQHAPDNGSDGNNNGSNSNTPSDSIASSSGTSANGITGQRESSNATISATSSLSDDGHSYPVLKNESTHSSSSNSTMMSRTASVSQCPLPLHQFTHHPPQHYHHQHHIQHHSTTTIDEDDHHPCLSPPPTSPTDDETLPNKVEGSLALSSPHDFFNAKDVPREHSESSRPFGQSTSLPSMPLYLASDPAPHSMPHKGKGKASLAMSANVDVDALDGIHDGEACALDRTVHEPRTSNGCFSSKGNLRAEDNSLSSNQDLLKTPPPSAVTAVPQDYAATANNGGAGASRRGPVGMAQLDLSRSQAVHHPAALIEALPSSPSFASYCISSTPAKATERAGQASPFMSHPLPVSSNTPARRFISPNALLHRRLITKSQLSPSKRNRVPLSNIIDEAAMFAGPSQERRRSSLGNELSPSSSSSDKRDAAPPSSSMSTFQLQPVPLGKRKKASRSSLARKKTSDVASPRMEKRLRIDSTSTLPSIASRQYKGLLTSVFRPADSLAREAQNIRQDSVLRSRLQSKKPHIALAGVNTPSQPRTRISRPKLNRTQSLPNLKAVPEVDLSLAVTHRLALPPRLVDYLSSLRERAQQQLWQPPQSISPDGIASTPSLNRDRMTSSAMAAHASSFARNGYCSTTVDAQGNVRTIFIPSLHPPITRQTLKELDLHEILKNPQLRHDIVFDANVQFRPNFDGERGRKKKELGNKYWYAIQKEVETGCTCTSFNGMMLLTCSCGMGTSKTTAIGQSATSLSSIKSPMPSLANYSHSGIGSNGTMAAVPMTPAQSHSSAKVKSPQSATGLGAGRIPSRIPLLIQELRAICLSVLPSTSSAGEPETPASARINTSVPTMGNAYTPFSARFTAKTPLTASSSVASHHILIAQSLDPLLITQQLQHGLLDIASLISLLGSILKLHCAPMRDEAIETMIKTICVDGEIAVGLRMCFEILELMKLDTANHQLRSSRMYLIETAVDFEIRYFRDQLDQGKITLDRTKQWFTLAIEKQKTNPALNTLTRTKTITKSFDLGLLQLIMDPPADLAASSSAPNTSTSSLKHAYTNNYPETFQFDSYRLMSFHGDVTDITIVYMLLLLFRQLACSSTNLAQVDLPTTTLSASAISDNASSLATRQLNSVKNEIWTLLNDADQEISTAGVCHPPSTSATPKTNATPAVATSRLLSQSALSGSHKLENPIWRRAMNDVVLQIAARAIEVQMQARRDSKAVVQPVLPSIASPPREETMKMLMAWVETNLRRESGLHRLCQQRLKNVLYALLDDDQSSSMATKASRKEREESGEETPGKRIRLQEGAVAVTHTQDKQSISMPSKTDVEIALQKGGLEPFMAEIKLLSERIIKVRSFHLRVFRSLYEKLAGGVAC